MNITDYLFVDDRIENLQFNTNLGILAQTFSYGPTIMLRHPLTAVQIAGIGSNVLSMVPRTESLQIGYDRFNDWLGKPIRFSIEIESELLTEIFSLAYHWRPIHTYLR